MLLQTNSYIVPKEKRSEHARLMRRFKQVLGKLGCDMFEIYEQVGANWNGGDTSGRYVQIMRFRDRKHQVAVQNAERSDPAAQTLIAEFCELVNFQYQQQQGFFAVGFYNSVLPSATARVQAAEPEETDEVSAAEASATSFSDTEMVEPADEVLSEGEAEAAGPGTEMVEGELVSEGDASAISHVEPRAGEDHSISALEPAEMESTEEAVEESGEIPDEESAVEESAVEELAMEETVAEASPEADAASTDVEEIDGEAGEFESESVEPGQITSESAPLEVVESMESEEHPPMGAEPKSLEEEQPAEHVTKQYDHAATSAGSEAATNADEYHFGDNGEEEHREEHAVAEHPAEHPETEVPEQSEEPVEEHTIEEHRVEEHTEAVADAPVEEAAEVVEEHTEANGEQAEVEQPVEPSSEESEPAPARRSLFRRRRA